MTREKNGPCKPKGNFYEKQNKESKSNQDTEYLMAQSSPPIMKIFFECHSYTTINDECTSVVIQEPLEPAHELQRSV